MSLKTPSQISIKDIKISSDRIEVLGQVNGIPIYVRPTSQGGFKKVGIVMPGRYLGEHGAAVQGMKQGVCQFHADDVYALSALVLSVDGKYRTDSISSKIKFLENHIKELKGKLRPTEEAERERDVALVSAQEHAQKLVDQNKIIDQLCETRDPALRNAVVELCGAQLVPSGCSTGVHLSALIKQLRHSNERIKSLEIQLKGEAEGRANDHRLVTNELNKCESYNEKLNELLAHSNKEAEALNDDRMKAWAARESARGLLLDTLKLGARIAQEVL